MKVLANGLQIEVDLQGPPDGEPLLLIMGLGIPLVGWPDELVADLVARGFRAIRFDNRDIGLSQGFERLGVPSLARASLRYMLRLRVHAPYSLADMAADALGVLDALSLASAHLCGASMGGMIAQRIAASHPQRVRSLTLVMTTSGARHLPQPRLAVRQALLKRPRSQALPDVVAHLERLLQIIGSPMYRPDAARQRLRLEAMVRRAWRPDGAARQLLAVAADGDRSPMLGRIRPEPGYCMARPTRWCRWLPRRIYRPRSPVPCSTWCPAWGMTCRWHCCRALPRPSPTLRTARRLLRAPEGRLPPAVRNGPRPARGSR